ncbi:methylenetetrahydrofolate reductase [Buchnera aphidicola]|uniref:Methylenetetrahydrofolate reductase n=1 Tax=Buchnera aphidicola (Anoecia oenotherae) TaxID=1241833 RepID=A0A4D6XYP9_9GAMM|nr:methylenetetrahydrofolate reductase [Buchnera aphidicola]QCI19180.1 5,10-methylenetetrahydrofolate reductase [Buchnera aphidicola (Anoecia oenotherae)]
MLSSQTNYNLEKQKGNLINSISISFEFFPPKNEESITRLLSDINEFTTLNPSFISITCSPHKKTTNHTYKLIKKIKEQNRIHTVPHVTCINHKKKELKTIAKKYWKNGVKSILALRGDKIKNSNSNTMYAIDLINILKTTGNFNVYVAAYPEVHPEAKNPTFDLLNLKNKFLAGANSAITQFFFNAETYLRFRDKCSKIGIYNDIIPGILPIVDIQQLKRFSSMTNVNIPIKIFKLLDNLTPNSIQFNIISSYITNSIIDVLYREGVRKFHFYTLNKLYLAHSIAYILKMKNFSEK